jgi:hypothetical protein
MIKPLPNWAYLDSRYAFSDTESATAVEQTAKLYKKIQELITTWNTFEIDFRNELDSFKKDITDKETCFENSMVTLIHNYIHQIDDTIARQNIFIEDVKNNMIEVSRDIVESMFENGEVTITTYYNEETESLDLIAGTNGGVE